MEDSFGNRGDERDEDEAAVVGAFFLPGGILDPEDDSVIGYRDDVSYDADVSFLVPPLSSPVSLNPWLNSNASTDRSPTDPVTKWIGGDGSSPQCLLSPTPLPSLSPPRLLGHSDSSFQPGNNTLSPANIIVPPPGFHSVAKTDSANHVSSSINDDSSKKETLALVDQMKAGGPTSFADVIRSSPCTTFTTPERQSNQRQPIYHTNNTEMNKKSYEIDFSTPQTKSISPGRRKNDSTASSASTVQQSRTRTNRISKHIERTTISSTEWNSVDRNSTGRASSRLDNVGTSPPPRDLQSGGYPHRFYDSENEDQSTTDSSSAPSFEPTSSLGTTDDINVDRSQIPQPMDVKGDSAETHNRPDVPHRREAKVFVRKDSKPVNRSQTHGQFSTAPFLEPSNRIKRNTASTQSESVFKDVLAVFVPLLRHLVAVTVKVILFLWEAAQLVTAGVRNVLVYATWESFRWDGALSCYLVLYILPTICDWIMLHASLPPFSPHIISTVSLYFLSGFPDMSATKNSGKVSDEVCRLLLNTFRYYLPLSMIFEGFRGPNTTIMMLDKSTRLILAYLLSMLRAGLLFSPIGWLGWSVQVLISVWLPEGIVLSCILPLLGLALIQFMSALPAHTRAASLDRT